MSAPYCEARRALIRANGEALILAGTDPSVVASVVHDLEVRCLLQDCEAEHEAWLAWLNHSKPLRGAAQRVLLERYPYLDWLIHEEYEDRAWWGHNRIHMAWLMATHPDVPEEAWRAMIPTFAPS